MDKMERVNKLLELDIYFKYYELYKKYISNVYNQHQSLLNIREKIKNTYSTKDNKNSIFEKFETAIEQIEDENNFIDGKFSNYDFSKEKIKENITDYKILSYQFAKENIKIYLDTWVSNNGKFPDLDELTYCVNKIEMALWNFFTKNFTYNDDILEIFDKAKAEFLDNNKYDYCQTF